MGLHVHTHSDQSTKRGSTRPEVLEFRKVRKQIARRLFVGGVSDQVSSGLLEEILRQFARL